MVKYKIECRAPTESEIDEIIDLMNDVGFQPSTPLDVGLAKFVDWYRGYYKV